MPAEERRIMALDKATITRIAHLARIRIPDQRLDALTGELANIMTWIEQLAEVDTADVPPMTSVTEQTLPRRADAVTEGDQADRILANAPAVTRGFFTVPKVIE